MANEWILELLEHLPQGVSAGYIVFVCDNAFCHSRFEQCIATHTELKILRIGPYSPMLNRMEAAWSKM